MMFVDGENFAIRGKNVAEAAGRQLKRSEVYEPDVYLWFPNRQASLQHGIGGGRLTLEPRSIRSFYYTSVQGDQPRVEETERSLWALGFTPVVFKKSHEKRKRVDIQLTIDVLSNAFLGNYDLCLLVAGDEDYVPIVKEVHRFGKVVSLVFFGGDVGGLSPALKLASDEFFDVTETFIRECTTSHS